MFLFCLHLHLLLGLAIPPPHNEGIYMKKKLSAALAYATSTSCNGYEVDDVIYEAGSDIIRLECCTDMIARVRDQEVEINADGEAFVGVVEADGGDAEVWFEFRVSIPIRECDFA